MRTRSRLRIDRIIMYTITDFSRHGTALVLNPEHILERLSKLATHDTVQQEVHRTVHEYRDVKDIA